MNLETLKSVDDLREFILNSEKNIFKYSIEIYLQQGYALTQIKAQVKDFYNWVDTNLPFTISTANRRMLLYITAKERELVNASLRDLNNNLLAQIEDIWKEIEGVKVTPIQKQEKITERFVEREVRTLSRMHPDKPSFYQKTEDKHDEIAKHLRESWTILSGIENAKGILEGWYIQFNTWKATIKKYKNESLNSQEEKINKLIKEVKHGT